tara:strand:+ start:3186 stop:3605 length:420 start_codon:yes stop_codon:yes gene_type:complete
MRISKLLGALGNLDKIAEGIKNKIFKNDDVEAVAKLRWMECTICPLLDRKGGSCAVTGTQPCCSDCGCSISLKIRAMSSSCPKGRWQAIMPEQMENELKKQLYFGHEAKKEYDKKLEQLKKEQKEKLAEQIKNRDASNI